VRWQIKVGEGVEVREEFSRELGDVFHGEVPSVRIVAAKGEGEEEGNGEWLRTAKHLQSSKT
jgi:hypothetical protein